VYKTMWSDNITFQRKESNIERKHCTRRRACWFTVSEDVSAVVGLHRRATNVQAAQCGCSPPATATVSTSPGTCNKSQPLVWMKTFRAYHCANHMKLAITKIKSLPQKN